MCNTRKATPWFEGFDSKRRIASWGIGNKFCLLTALCLSGAANAQSPNSGSVIANLGLDYFRLSSTYEFQHWKPQGIPEVYYETAGINLMELDAGFGLKNLPYVDTFEFDFSYNIYLKTFDGFLEF